MSVLSVQGLIKHYPGFQLDNVSFQLERGRIMGFIGRNGAGKTTTLKALLNFVHPDAGEIAFFGERFSTHEMDIKRRIGFVSGGADYYIKKKLRAITQVTSRFYPNWDEAAYRSYMERFSLDENKTPEKLSAGMKVKYALTLALSHNAELLILDEPTSGLDPVSRDDLLDVFLSLAEQGTTILFSTHITSDLDKCADDITYIRNGKILASTEMGGFLGRYRVAEIADCATVRSLGSRLIGAKRAKQGYTALIETRDAEEIHLSNRPADLEDVMVHFEKE